MPVSFQARKSYEKDINLYRCMYQRKEDQRDFDLYDPDGKKKSLPARVADNDPRLSLSGAQRYASNFLVLI